MSARVPLSVFVHEDRYDDGDLAAKSTATTADATPAIKSRRKNSV